MDALGWLKLQLEWGADEALDDGPADRRTVNATATPGVLPAPATPFALAKPPLAPVRTGTAAAAQAQSLAAAAQTLDQLRDALAGFDGCALRATATNLVFGEGDPSTGLVLLADVPGPAEDRAGVPFAGAAALFLDKMLASIGLERSAFYAASLLPWRPPGDRKPTEGEIQLCLPFLLRHLELLAPRRVLLFGNLAARTLLPGDGRRARAVWLEMPLSDQRPAVQTLVFPSILHIQSTPAAKREAWANLLRFRRVLGVDHG